MLAHSQQTYVENSICLNTRVEFIDSLLLACDNIERPGKVGRAVVLQLRKPTLSCTHCLIMGKQLHMEPGFCKTGEGQKGALEIAYMKHQHSIIVVVIITKMDVLKNYRQYILRFSLREDCVFRKLVCCILTMWENYPLQQFSAEKKSFSLSSSLGLQDSSREETQRGLGSQNSC